MYFFKFEEINFGFCVVPVVHDLCALSIVSRLRRSACSRFCAVAATIVSGTVALNFAANICFRQLMALSLVYDSDLKRIYCRGSIRTIFSFLKFDTRTIYKRIARNSSMRKKKKKNEGRN